MERDGGEGEESDQTIHAELLGIVNRERCDGEEEGGKKRNAFVEEHTGDEIEQRNCCGADEYGEES